MQSPLSATQTTTFDIIMRQPRAMFYFCEIEKLSYCSTAQYSYKWTCEHVSVYTKDFLFLARHTAPCPQGLDDSPRFSCFRATGGLAAKQANS